MMKPYKIPEVNIWIDLDSIIAISDIHCTSLWDITFTVTCKFLNNPIVIGFYEGERGLDEKEVVGNLKTFVHEPLINEWLKTEV